MDEGPNDRIAQLGKKRKGRKTEPVRLSEGVLRTGGCCVVADVSRKAAAYTKNMQPRIFHSALVILTLLTLSSTLNGLLFGQTTLRIGVEGGLSIAKQFYSNEPYGDNSGISTKSRNGAIIGAIVEFALSEPFFIVSELRYIQKGVRFEGFPMFPGNPPYGFGDLEYQLDYLEVVGNLKAKFGPESFKFFLTVAPTLGLLLSSRAIQPIWETTGNHYTNDVDAKESTEPFEFSMSGGVGIEYSLSEQLSMWIGGQYSLGLTEVYKSSDSFNRFTQSGGIQVLGGLLFNP